MRWQLEFFEDSNGVQPVRVWLDSLSEEVRIKLEALIDLLADKGPTLDFPYCSQVEGKLRELRQRFGKTRYRVLYFFDSNRTGVLLHGIKKNTARLEEADKAIGRTRMKQHLGRSNKTPSKKKK